MEHNSAHVYEDADDFIERAAEIAGLTAERKEKLYQDQYFRLMLPHFYPEISEKFYTCIICTRILPKEDSGYLIVSNLVHSCCNEHITNSDTNSSIN